MMATTFVRSRWQFIVTAALATMISGCQVAVTPERERQVRSIVPDHVLRTRSAPTSAPPVSSRSVPKELGEMRVEVIDFVTALRLAGAQTVDVAVLRERIEAAKADVDQASARFLPELRLGTEYLRHDGRLQNSRGLVFDVSRSSITAQPNARLTLTPGDAYFERLRTLQLLEATEHGEDRTEAESMVRAAMLYYRLLGAQAQVAVAREAVELTQAQVELNERLVEAEAELRVNLVRAQAEAAREQERLLGLVYELRRASVELALWLQLPPKTFLQPAESQIQPIELVDRTQGVDALIESALSRRPDVMEFDALRRAAEENLRGARWRPWIPEISAFAGYGAFGGGRNHTIGEFGDRFDGGAGLSWVFDGLGFGDLAQVRRARAELNEANLRLGQLRDQIAAEVINNRERIRILEARISTARSRIAASEETLTLVRARVRRGDAIQIEELAAIRELAAARALLVEATNGYNQAQYILFYLVEGAAWIEPSRETLAPAESSTNETLGQDQQE